MLPALREASRPRGSLSVQHMVSVPGGGGLASVSCPARPSHRLSLGISGPLKEKRGMGKLNQEPPNATGKPHNPFLFNWNSHQKAVTGPPRSPPPAVSGVFRCIPVSVPGVSTGAKSPIVLFLRCLQKNNQTWSNGLQLTERGGAGRGGKTPNLIRGAATLDVRGCLDPRVP